jgi:hypothetical protein
MPAPASATFSVFAIGQSAKPKSRIGLRTMSM